MGRSMSLIQMLTRLGLVLLYSQHVTALYFLIDGTTEKCFYEDLPKDTIVVGKHLHFLNARILTIEVLSL